MASESGPASSPIAGTHVLLVEDNHVNRLVAKAVLERLGVGVEMVTNGREAIEALAIPGRFDAVLMDVQMPELDGYEATRRIRQMPGGTRLPIIAMTAQAHPEERRKCLEAGMNDQIAKPVDAGQLAVALARWLDRDRATDGTGAARASAHAAGGADGPSALPDQLPGIDISTALRRLGGNRPLLARLLGAFSRDVIGGVDRIRQALDAHDLGSARQLLHTLKGEAGNVSATEIWNVARAMESALHQNDAARATELLQSLRHEVDRTVAGLASLPPEPVSPSTEAVAPLEDRRALAAARANQPTILIADDAPVNVETLRSILEDMCRVVVSGNGYEALALAMTQSPDLILLDVVMPGMDGYETCRRLKSDPMTARIPVIFVTAMEEEEDEARGLELGAIDYLTKPLKAPIIRARVRNHLELKRYRDLLESLSTLDPLTGIANRRRLDEALDQEWRRSLRAPAPLSVIFVDIDCFKAFNDTYGHAAGDECLRLVASALANGTRRFTDVVARYGGEEFACVLPATDVKGAAIIANRLREAVEALRVPHSHSLVTDHVTISLGVATVLPSARTSVAELTEAADRRLYEAKRAGRNRVVAQE